MSDAMNIFMPGRVHWEEYKQAEKQLLVEAKKGGSGPGPLDLDEGFLIMKDRTGAATETSTDIGNPHRVRTERPAEEKTKSAADDITQTPATADPVD